MNFCCLGLFSLRLERFADTVEESHNFNIITVCCKKILNLPQYNYKGDDLWSQFLRKNGSDLIYNLGKMKTV
jgi:hypothetical protein